MIGIIGAMDIEVENLISAMTGSEEHKYGNLTFYKGEIENKKVVVAKSGIGKVSAAMCAQTMILKFSPSLVINTGIAGSLNKNVSIKDVVIAESVVQYDMDTSAIGDPVGLISGINIVEIPVYKEAIKKMEDACKNLNIQKCHVGVIATGDKFISKKEDANYISNTFNALACEMEGASIGQVCYCNDVNFLVVRSISDGGNEEAQIDYPTFAKIAAENSKKIIFEYLKD